MPVFATQIQGQGTVQGARAPLSTSRDWRIVKASLYTIGTVWTIARYAISGFAIGRIVGATIGGIVGLFFLAPEVGVAIGATLGSGVGVLFGEIYSTYVAITKIEASESTGFY